MKSSLPSVCQTRPLPHRRAGFTLVELLVVIVIIAMLAGLITAVAFPMIAKARTAAIKAEMTQIEMALKTYKERYGALPPSSFANKAEVERHINKAFGQHQEFGTTQWSNYSTTIARLTPAQALVFWLGGFSSDPEHPLTGPGGPLNGTSLQFERNSPIFEFDKSRLVNTANSASFADPSGLNVPVYVPSNGEGVPYVYFRSQNYMASTSASASFNSTVHGLSAGTARPYPTEATATVLRWANPDSYQIISAGLDGQYGVGGVYPTGAASANAAYVATGYATGETGDHDNVTNFSEKSLGDSLPE